jgi:peroxiredoxin Q/BCP
MNLKAGDKAPSINSLDQHGRPVSLDDFKGSKVILYFYPKDDTPGCTAQACSFRDQYEDFAEANAVVIGISGQSAESHKNFADKHRLTYTLLSDEENKVRKQFGVPTIFFGLLPGRVTYVINSANEVVYIFNSQTKVNEHVTKTLEILSKYN